jgi:Cytochrome C'
MSRSRLVGGFVVGAILLMAVSPAEPQTGKPAIPPAKPPLKLEPVAETRLLMEGMAQANFNGLERLLKDKPADNETWAFARGQALLIAETGNLLMLRPPKNPGETAWMDHSRELRDAATALAKNTAARDYEGSRNALGDLAVSCNRCHQTFRVQARIVPFASLPPGK